MEFTHIICLLTIGLEISIYVVYFTNDGNVIIGTVVFSFLIILIICFDSWLSLDIFLICILAFKGLSINPDGHFVFKQAQILLSMLSPYYDQRNFTKTKSIKGEINNCVPAVLLSCSTFLLHVQQNCFTRYVKWISD